MKQPIPSRATDALMGDEEQNGKNKMFGKHSTVGKTYCSYGAREGIDRVNQSIMQKILQLYVLYR